MPRQATAPAACTSKRTFRRLCAEGISALGLTHLELKPYSFRRGGATYDFGSVGDLPRTLWRGRWASHETGRFYIQEGVAVQTQMRISDESRVRMLDATNAFQTWTASFGRCLPVAT